ncbi:hypothetical protein BDV93DRAFT_564902 [Ceratobasidium sp. AG-I]|nr:hypothetical protein BDV93DRAFT_564902 [Ceratobasidium sp. AG-I]
MSDQQQEIQGSNVAERRRSNRVSQPARKVVETQEQQFEACGLLNAAQEVIVSHYGFILTSGNPESEVRDRKSDIATALLEDDAFTFGGPDNRDDPYQNPLFLFLFQKCWFSDARSAGISHPDMFFPVKSTTLAYLAAVLEKSLKEWKPGARTSIAFTTDNHRARISYFCAQIKKFQDHPLVRQAGIYDEYLRGLEQSARNTASAHTKPGDLENSVEVLSDNVPGGLAEEDIRRSLRKHRVSHRQETANSVPRLDQSNEDGLVIPGQSGALGIVLVPETQDEQQDNLNMTFSADARDSLLHASNAGPPYDKRLNGFNASGAFGSVGDSVWASSSQLTTDSQACSTIYPPDSVSQQLVLSDSQQYAEENMPTIGFLDQMNAAPFLGFH